MSVAKVAISMDRDLVVELDRLVERRLFASRSQAVQAAVREKVARLKRLRLAEECARWIRSTKKPWRKRAWPGSWRNGPNIEGRDLLGRPGAGARP